MRIVNGLVLYVVAFAVFAPMLAFAGTSGPSPIPNPPNFQITTTATTLCSGQVNYIPVTVFNKGSAVSLYAQMQNVQLSITNTGYLHTLLNGSADVGTVGNDSGASTYIPVFVAANSSSILNVEFNINYYYYLYYSDSETRNMSFGVRTCPSQLSVAVPSAVLTSGEIQNISIVLANSGSSRLSNISISASMPLADGAVLTSQPVDVNTIPAGGSVALNESIYVLKNATQAFPINITANFYNGSALGQIADKIMFLSSGVIDISQSGMTVSPQVPTPGSIFSVSFVLTDVGTSGASAVTATSVPPSGISAFGTDSTFVGDMAVDSQTPVTLTLLASRTLKSGNYTVPIKINYLNSLRQNKSTTIYVPIQIGAANLTALGSGAPAGKGVVAKRSGGGLLVLILLAVVIVLIFLLYRERKSHHKK